MAIAIHIPITVWPFNKINGVLVIKTGWIIYQRGSLYNSLNTNGDYLVAYNERKPLKNKRS